jgi:hypothetical protein
VTIPPITNTSRLGSHIPRVNSVRPAKSTGTDTFSVVAVLAVPSAICAIAPAANAEKATAPATAYEVSCMVPARKPGMRELQTP